MSDFAVIATLVIDGFVSFFISYKLHGRLVKSANKNAMFFSILAFIGSLLLITTAIVFIILYRIPFER